MGWLHVAAGALACVALLCAPGLLIGLGLRLRGLALVAAAPALGLTAIFIGGYAADFLGLRWSVLAPLAIATVVAALLWLITQLIPSSRITAATAYVWWVPLLALTVAATLLCAQIAVSIGSPDYFAQEHDNVFHLNAVRHILDTGVATPRNTAMTLGRTSPTGYPSAWHALNALVVQTTSLGVAGASNASLLAVAGFVWPLAVLLLTRAIAGVRSSAAIAAGVLCTTYSVFPMLPITEYGGYPLVLAIAVTPVALTAVLQLARASEWRTSAVTAGLVLALTAPGLVGAHPSALVWVACMTVPVVAIRVMLASRSLTNASQRGIAWLAFATYSALVFLLLLVMPMEPAYSTTSALGDAIAESLTGTIGGQWSGLLVALMCAIAVVGVIRRSTVAGTAACAVWLLSLGLYVVAAAGPDLLRIMLTSAWYANPARLAAFIPVAAVPLAALGAASAWDALVAARQSSAPLPRRVRLLTGAALAVSLVATQVSTASATMLNRSSFAPTGDHNLARLAVDDDARQLLQVLAEYVPEDDLIANNSWDGSGFVYALTGRRVLLPHQIMTLRPEVTEFLDGFATAGEDSPACQATRDLGIRWVIRFQTDSDLGRGALDYRGLDGLEVSSNVDLVKRIGTASLYRVVGCGVG